MTQEAHDRIDAEAASTLASFRIRLRLQASEKQILTPSGGLIILDVILPQTRQATPEFRLIVRESTAESFAV